MEYYLSASLEKLPLLKDYPYVLISVLQILKGRKRIWEEFLESRQEGYKVMVDSGAYTLQKKGEVEEIVEKYIEVLRRYPQITYFVEIDVDTRYPLSKIEYWRKKIEDAVGRQPIVVWHRHRGIDYFYRMIEEYEYIGLARDVGVNREKLEKLSALAHRYKRRVHGFALSNYFYLFDSVDSTTWIKGPVYGFVVDPTSGLFKPYLRRSTKKVSFPSACQLWLQHFKKLDQLKTKEVNLIEKKC